MVYHLPCGTAARVKGNCSQGAGFTSGAGRAASFGLHAIGLALAGAAATGLALVAAPVTAQASPQARAASPTPQVRTAPTAPAPVAGRPVQITGDSANTVLQLMQVKWPTSRLVVDNPQTLSIIVPLSTTDQFKIMFWGCQQQRACVGASFIALVPNKGKTMAQVNEWAKEKVVVSPIYMNAQNTLVRTDMLLVEGGISQNLFLAYFASWGNALQGFDAPVGTKPAPAKTPAGSR